MGPDRAPALRPLEIASGSPLGLDPIPPLADTGRAVSPIAAIESVLLEALKRPPCLVSFSGGRDSSAMLATAVRVARREGLALPVPATLVFPGSSETMEDEWQAMVLQHLGLSDWIRIEIHDELDAVGPVATEALARHGLLWPCNVHFHIPIIQRATGGSVVTGFGGDELGACAALARAERRLASRRRPHWRDVLIVGLAVAPSRVRAAVYRRRFRSEVSDYPWLTAEGVRQLTHAHGALDSSAPLGWDAKIRRWFWRDRYLRICAASFRAVGAHSEVAVVHPFVEEGVLSALADAGGFSGFGSRLELLENLFGDALPARTIQRRTKATFASPLWTGYSHDFARSWSGGGVDGALVDPLTLRRRWQEGNWTPASTTLLQAAWLHDRDLSA